MTDLHASIHQAAHSGAFGAHQAGRPSEAQCRAGNYRKGRVVVQGLRIAIEVPRNEERRGVDPNGTAWACRMAAHYGYFEKTRGRDGDEVDVFLGPVPESPRVYVVNQNDAAGAFDEHKVMLGFNDADAARAAYLGSYSPGWQGLGSIVGATVRQLRWWLKHGDTERPFSANALPYDGEADMTPTTWDANAMPVQTDLAALLYNMRRSEDAPLLLDAVTAADVLEGVEELPQFDALVVVNQRLNAKMEQIRRVMATVSDSIEPTAMQITPPFRQRGTTHICAIFELSDGQTVTIWFHNPDSTPNKILPTDELVSWKWMLNKLDITIVVAPERGRDLNPREVARRIMRLAEKNSAKFQKANAGRAERLAKVEQLRGEVAGKEAQLQGLEAEIEALTAQLEAKQTEPELDPEITPVADPEPTPEPEPEVPAESFVDRVRGLIPAEFETKDLGADDITAIAADGLGIRVMLKSFTSGRQSAAAYVVDAKGQDSMGHAAPDEVQSLIADALSVIAEKRAAVVPEPEPVDEFAEVDAILAGFGFKRVMSNDWASPAIKLESGTGAVSYNVRAGGEPLQYILRKKVTFPGITGAGQQVGTYSTIKALVEALRSVSLTNGEPEPEAAGDPIVITFGLGQGTEMQSIRDLDKWLARNVSAEQLETSGDQGVGFIRIPNDGDIRDDRLLYRTNDGELVYWDLASRSVRKVSEGDYRIHLTPVPEPTPEPEANPAEDAARALLQAVVDGSEDLFAADLAGRLEEVYNSFTDNADLMALFEEAANVYSAAVVAKAKEALAAA